MGLYIQELQEMVNAGNPRPVRENKNKHFIKVRYFTLIKTHTFT